MSKQLQDYGAQKSVGITTAKRLAEFLGDEMVQVGFAGPRHVVCGNFLHDGHLALPAGAPGDRARHPHRHLQHRP